MDRDRSVGALFGMPGQSLWVRQLGGTGNDQGAKLAVDGAGDVVATGIFSGTITVGGTTLTAAGGTDVYVAKLAPADG
ncbi:MAG: SBBP repeat-containing protein, partial [Deltaproteobacteria bacterium]|nr:SBBP repeat-containing protein [Deltaproteobacteria bacterium]